MHVLNQRPATLPESSARLWTQPHVLRAFLTVPDAAANLSSRGVKPANPERAEALRGVALRFLSGCNAMFLADPLNVLDDRLSSSPPEQRGFVVEGAGMGAVVRDALSRRGALLSGLIDRQAAGFEYLIAVGVGWGLARVPWRAKSALAHLDPVVAPLAWDGRGFHDMYFKPGTALQARSMRLKPAERRVYDNGLGRAIWFVASGCPARAADLISGCDPTRQPDLAAGLGLAMAYAGPVVPDDWNILLNRLPDLRANLGQGVCFAAEAHRCCGLQPETVETAARSVCGLPAETAARLAQQTRPEASQMGPVDFAAFLEWRRVITASLAQQLSQEVT